MTKEFSRNSAALIYIIVLHLKKRIIVTVKDFMKINELKKETNI